MDGPIDARPSRPLRLVPTQHDAPSEQWTRDPDLYLEPRDPYAELRAALDRIPEPSRTKRLRFFADDCLEQLRRLFTH